MFSSMLFKNVVIDIFALTSLSVFGNTSASKFPLALLDLIGPCLSQSDERFLLSDRRLARKPMIGS